MIRRNKAYILLISLLVISGSHALLKAQTAEHPNVIMFATDDLNAWVNPLGYEQAITPNLDRLAEMGVSFTNAHAPAAYCAPSRSAIWSGLHAFKTGCYNDELYFYDMPELVSMQNAFDQEGYKTYGAGKLYHHRAGSYDTRGWDEYFSRSQEIRDWGYEMGYRGSDVPFPDPHPYSPVYTDSRSNRYLEPGETIDYGAFLEWGPIAPEDAEKIPDAVRTNWVCDLLGQEHTDPFFIALGLYSPHFPNYAPQEFFDLYNRDSIEVPYLYGEDLDDLPDHIRNRMTNRLNIQANLEVLDAVEDAVMGYLACVSFADAMLGRVLDALEASAYKDNTYVMFWSDQGYHHGEKGQWGKHTLWQETSHVPFIIAGNGLPQNKEISTTVSLIDIYPTLIDLCNLSAQHDMDGESLAPVLQDPLTAADRDVLMAYMERGGYAVINSRWRYIQYHDSSEELYDLENDPNEWYNLANEQEYQDTIVMLRQSAPTEFHIDGTPRNTLNLIIQDNTFFWEPSDKSKPATFYNYSISYTNPIQEKGISFLETTHPDSLTFTEQKVKLGKDCRYIPQGKTCFFMVEDQYIKSQDNFFTFHITYFDDSNSTFELQYNAVGNADQSIVISKTNSLEWVTKSIMVADAAFDNQLSGQYDFCIKGDVYIQSIAIDKPLPSDVSVVFDEQIIENGMQFLVRTDPTKETYTEKSNIGEHICRWIPNLDKRKYGYFQIDDAIINSADRNLTFEITYYDNSTSYLRVQYNSTSENYKKTDITMTDTRKWVTKTFPVGDAALSNSQNNQSDFRIPGEAYIRRVAVRLGTDTPEIPEVPILYRTPEDPVDTTSVSNVMLEKPAFDVKYSPGWIKVTVPDELLQSSLSIFNYMGQQIYHGILDHTEKMIPCNSDSNYYILVVQHGKAYLTRTIVSL